MTPTIKLLGMLFGLILLGGLPDQSVPDTPSWRFAVSTYEEPRPLAQTYADLITFLQEAHPELVADLNPPATDAQLDALEALIGQRLPEDFRQLYRLANGQRQGATPLFQEGYAFLSLDEVSENWLLMKSLYDDKQGFWENDTPQGAVKDRWWHPSWIPFALMISGDMYCIDLDPASGGQVGQVLELIHDDTGRAHLGFSLNDFLGSYEQGLREGTYWYHPEWDAFVPREDG